MVGYSHALGKQNYGVFTRCSQFFFSSFHPVPRKPGNNYSDYSIAQFKYSGKNANVYNTNLFASNFKNTLYITLLKAKLLAKIIEISTGNKKICCKKNKL